MGLVWRLFCKVFKKWPIECRCGVVVNGILINVNIGIVSWFRNSRLLSTWVWTIRDSRSTLNWNIRIIVIVVGSVIMFFRISFFFSVSSLFKQISFHEGCSFCHFLDFCIKQKDFYSGNWVHTPFWDNLILHLFGMKFEKVSCCDSAILSMLGLIYLAKAILSYCCSCCLF